MSEMLRKRKLVTHLQPMSYNLLDSNDKFPHFTCQTQSEFHYEFINFTFHFSKHKKQKKSMGGKLYRISCEIHAQIDIQNTAFRISRVLCVWSMHHMGQRLLHKLCPATHTSAKKNTSSIAKSFQS